ncbi:hypothetical protein DMN91_006928 [Ooceraea biroi]|uniref:Uncharacterized protein n=1 Tax=Ooceraea biroi TaxID=2015173 RepID=A0A3L8DIQ0_OOCBI|nr:hypothetical protein DMN91_006928 [Ooceraea biroi]
MRGYGAVVQGQEEAKEVGAVEDYAVGIGRRAREFTIEASSSASALRSAQAAVDVAVETSVEGWRGDFGEVGYRCLFHQDIRRDIAQCLLMSVDLVYRRNLSHVDKQDVFGTSHRTNNQRNEGPLWTVESKEVKEPEENESQEGFDYFRAFSSRFVDGPVLLCEDTALWSKGKKEAKEVGAVEDYAERMGSSTKKKDPRTFLERGVSADATNATIAKVEEQKPMRDGMEQAPGPGFLGSLWEKAR